MPIMWTIKEETSGKYCVRLNALHYHKFWSGDFRDAKVYKTPAPAKAGVTKIKKWCKEHNFDWGRPILVKLTIQEETIDELDQTIS